MTQLHNGDPARRQASHEVARTMLGAIGQKYSELIDAARKEWERKFAGPDPADACVSVRINVSESRGDLSRMFPLESSRALEPFAAN